MNAPINRITLDLNVKAPDFNLIDVYDRPTSLAQLKGKKVFVAFFRHAGCPFCNLRVHFLQKHHQELKEKGLEMVFFFESSKKVLLSSSFHKEISPIPLISDVDKTWYNAYGIEESAAKSTKSHLTSFIQTAIKAKLNGLPMHMMAEKESIKTIPAEFLIDENGIIRKIHYANGLNDRMSIEHIYNFAQGKNMENAPVRKSENGFMPKLGFSA
ncbi:redoxin domain-containing protein [Fulvivirga lutimaris]|uniref:redoxin domain-containing protein n=1 Tax=Fulvivirga lutimaris TaxID=1819566 RepID=UPI0012BB9F41|nr:redoxin domain-containing protein [Fulvivirga lutimaris]MTI40686.1 redoxin domain-containing protein [Fulvivirga lutimaris]